MKDNIFVYPFEDNLYINLTNKCSNDCIFCVRNNVDGMAGNVLWLDREPLVSDVIQALETNNFKQAKQIVFCGFGEPTYRFDELVEIGRWLKSQDVQVRLDTNGQGSLINGYDIVPRLSKAITHVNVSLNNSSMENYQATCKSIFGETAYKELIGFALRCQNSGMKTTLSIVDSIGEEEITKCRQIAQNIGIELRVRKYIK